MNVPSTKIKILTLCSYVTEDNINELSRNKSGYGYMVSAITKSLSSKVNVDVFCWSGNYKALTVNGINYLDNRYIYLLSKISLKGIFQGLIFLLRNIIYLKEALRTAISFSYADFINNIAKEYQYIHVHGCTSNLYPLILKLAKNKNNILITLHGLLSSAPGTNPLDLLSERNTLKLFQKHKNISLSVLTPATKKKIINRYGKDLKDRISVIPNFSPNHFFASQERRIFKKEKIIQCIGNISERKNQKAIIYLVKKHKKDLLGKFKFKIIGGGGFKDPELKNIIRENKDLIEITGTLKQIEVISSYQNSDLTIQVSKDEGFGLPIIESLENKVPVLISSKIEIASYFNESSVVTFIEDVEDIDEILEKIYIALNKPQDFNHVSEILEQFSKKSIVNKYLEALQKA